MHKNSTHLWITRCMVVHIFVPYVGNDDMFTKTGFPYLLVFQRKLSYSMKSCHFSRVRYSSDGYVGILCLIASEPLHHLISDRSSEFTISSTEDTQAELIELACYSMPE
jgi:hypothetical protein